MARGGPCLLAVPLCQDGPRHVSERRTVVVRVIVIGAGIAGASVAYPLAAAGADVVVVDDAQPGRATSAGAGIITPVSARPVGEAKSRIMFAAVEHYLDLVRRFEESGLSDHSYGVTGELIAAFDNDELRRLSEVAERAEARTGRYGTAGVGVPKLFSRQDVHERFPLLPGVLGGVWLPDVARVDGRIIRDHLMTLAAQLGAQVLQGRAELVFDGSRVSGVRVPGEFLEGDHVVLAAGAWSEALVETTGLDLPVYPQRGQILHLRIPGGSTLPVISVFRGIYLLSFPGDRVVIGATREDDSGFATHATAGGVDMLIRKALGVVPSLQRAEWLEVRVGIRPASRDGEPLLGPAPGIDGLWLATGFGPQGLTLAPYSGRLLAEAIMGEKTEIPEILSAARLAAA
nr:FAD-dependent oxidoreductase [Phytoactinopolyspora mesophila]